MKRIFISICLLLTFSAVSYANYSSEGQIGMIKILPEEILVWIDGRMFALSLSEYGGGPDYKSKLSALYFAKSNGLNVRVYYSSTCGKNNNYDCAKGIEIVE